MEKTKKLTFSALFIAFGLVLPQFFHLFGGTGPIFLPMHIPVLLAGFFLGAPAGALVGVITPILSSVLTGMPQIPILYFMIIELAAYGFIAGFTFKNLKLNVYVSLILSMIIGRALLAAGVFALQPLLGLKLSPQAYMIGAVTNGIPGMILQLVFIPAIVLILMKAGVSVNESRAR